MNPWKPWFIFRPSQVFRRLTFQATSSYRPLEVAWGGFRARARRRAHRAVPGHHRASHRSRRFRNCCSASFILATSSVDAGANIGYMSVLAATAGARVIAFEPQSSSPAGPSSEPRDHGRGAPGRAGRAAAHGGASSRPDPSAHNNGLGRLGSDTEPGAVPVQVEHPR